MKKLLVLTLLVLPLGLFSFDWKKAGFEVLETRSLPKLKLQNLIIADQEKRTFEIKFKTDLSEEQIQSVLALRKRFYSWSNLSIKSISFVVWHNQTTIFILPEKFEYDGHNLAKAIPGGLTFFWYDNKLHYEFRILEGEQFLKLKGELADDASFFEKMKAPGPAFAAQEKQEELLKTAMEEEFRKELKKEVLKEEEKTEKPKAEEPGSFQGGLSFFMGSGALGSFAINLDLGWLELAPTAGFTFYYPDSANTSIKAMGIPAGMRVLLPLFDIKVIKPYLLGAVYYGFELENYQEQSIWLAGAGTYFLKYFFVEGSYLSNQNGQGIVIGFGTKFFF